MDHTTYNNPLVTRYASPEMSRLFSDWTKFTTWRKLWISLARNEQALGLPISDDQISAMEAAVENLDLDAAAEYEKNFRHDVMAHIHAFADVAPAARPIIHLGATSAFVGDNTDCIQMRDGLWLIRGKLLAAIANLRRFSLAYKDQPTLGFTHFQPAQLTTVGKRATLWLQDFVIDYHDLEHVLATLPFRGVKGTTGTQASYLDLFDGDHAKVEELDRRVAADFGFDLVFAVTGQTYTRKLDARVASLLAGICQSAAKMSHDIRLLAHLKEVEEPFETSQVGSSAMPYKRNPMRSERISSLARFGISLADSPAVTASTQWLERTLDDSANKRLTIPQLFLAVDAILKLVSNVTAGLVVYPRMIGRHIAAELPFIASENILMRAVKKGGDRQALHEEIRRLAQEAGQRVKEEGADNDLLDRIAASPAFNLDRAELDDIMDPLRYIGRAPEQVTAFITAEVDPILATGDVADQDDDLTV